MQGNGEYLLSLVGKTDAQTVGPKTIGVSVPYSPEYLGLDINYSLLNRLAERTGGKVLRPEAVEDAAQAVYDSGPKHLDAPRLLAVVCGVGPVSVYR